MVEDRKPQDPHVPHSTHSLFDMASGEGTHQPLQVKDLVWDQHKTGVGVQVLGALGIHKVVCGPGPHIIFKPLGRTLVHSASPSISISVVLKHFTVKIKNTEDKTWSKLIKCKKQTKPNRHISVEYNTTRKALGERRPPPRQTASVVTSDSVRITPQI